MTAHTVIFLDDPPAVLYVLPSLVLRIIKERLGNVGAFRTNTAKQESGQGVAPFVGQIRLRHAQPIFWVFLFALIINRRVGQLVLKETLVAVPLLILPIR